MSEPRSLADPGAPSANAPSDADSAAALARLPSDILASLSPAQRAQLAKLLDRPPRTPYPISLRLSLPFVRSFIAVIGGPERRSPERLAAEAKRHPVATLANLAFITLLTVVFTALALFVMLLASRVLE
jgi:hypothetical protein